MALADELRATGPFVFDAVCLPAQRAAMHLITWSHNVTADSHEIQPRSLMSTPLHSPFPLTTSASLPPAHSPFHPRRYPVRSAYSLQAKPTRYP